MEYRKLGGTGLEVSTYSLGAMAFGHWGNTDVDECIRIVHSAIDAGINLIDTADVYSDGESEKILAQALKGRRDDVLVATKFRGPMGPGKNDRGGSRHWILRAVEGSLRRLETDYIDLYQIHKPEPDTDIEETLGALTDLVKAGKVRYIGSSTTPAFEILRAQAASTSRGLERFVCEQAPYSILTRHIELDVLPVANRYRMGVIVWSPLAGGWLSGKYRGGQKEAGSRAERVETVWGPGHSMGNRFDMTRPGNIRKAQLIDGLAPIADKASLRLSHMAYAFVLSHPAVTSAIIGPRTPEQLEDALDGADVRLDDEILDAIDDVVPPGTWLEEADRGWEPPWMTAVARRRR